MDLLMKSHDYEEMFSMNALTVGILEFSKKKGGSMDRYDTYISSFITIQNEYAIYQEQIEYYLVPSMSTPILAYPTWKKNSVTISSKKIPSSIFKLLAMKHPSNMIYSSHPLSIIQYEYYF
jgi:hypothetical protein